MNFRIVFYLFPILGFCQNLIVTEISHKGNTFTKDYIIGREIQHVTKKSATTTWRPLALAGSLS